MPTVKVYKDRGYWVNSHCLENHNNWQEAFDCAVNYKELIISGVFAKTTEIIDCQLGVVNSDLIERIITAVDDE